MSQIGTHQIDAAIVKLLQLTGSRTAKEFKRRESKLQASVEPPRGDAITRVAVPSYFWVTWYNAEGGNKSWERMQSAAPYCEIAVLNPASGPGDAPSTDWSTQVVRAQAAGLKILGYVSTGYAEVPLASIKAQIDRYYAWYNVDGIFLDESVPDAERQPRYKELYDYIKAKDGRGTTVVINPGTPAIDESYMAACDIVMNYESPAAAYASASFPAWTLNYPSRRFWHCLVDVTSTEQRDSLLATARARRAGYVYLTPDNGANPYDTLPPDPFWSGLINAVR